MAVAELPDRGVLIVADSSARMDAMGKLLDEVDQPIARRRVAAAAESRGSSRRPAAWADRRPACYKAFGPARGRMIKVNDTRSLVAAIDGKRALVLFHATWCPYCRSFAPVFEEAGADAASWVPVEVVLDDDDNPLWDEFGIDVVPTLVLFENARPVKRVDAHHGIGLTRHDLRRILD